MSRAFPIALMLALGLVALGCEQQEPGGTEEPGAADTTEQATTAEPAEAAPAPETPEGKIASAESAAPPDIAKNATIMDWPAQEGGEPVQLRAGTNGWTCFPTTPTMGGATGEDPMCLDAEWLKFAQAWMGHTTPTVSAVGVGYMLRGDKGTSNIDPFATAPTSDNQWVQAGPHIMVITPDTGQLEAVPTDPSTGGPWVMWKGTPYAHIMVPVESPATRS
jgi:hypothetical protein